ncbi:ABC-2 type transporter [Bacillus methanolicus MGA3]|uniref:ABC-2 type transporter n=1 Tax=Bacillus methanolicus (strain MGA3 / ATCC 53907) TaxID=796606 RepID=A0A068LNM4_BACMM|nr:ABC transporter permease [Bacillus methanolicus]AIE59304.1 ABC-2 type transporter [Bacillus methanolicus MGA3]
MLLQMVKKDLLMFWRRPRELIVLLLMPFVLICILGNALSAVNNGEIPDISVKVGVIQKDHPEKGIEQIMEDLNNLPIPGEQKNQIKNGISKFHPIAVLTEEIFKSNELKDIIKVEQISEQEAEKNKKQYSGIIEIPENFTYDFYRKAIFHEKKEPQLKVQLNESEGLEAGVLRDILSTFQQDMSLIAAANSDGFHPESMDLLKQTHRSLGSIETITAKEPISSVAYYAVGMSVMFIFYVASTVATYAYEQKESLVFNRIILANVPVFIFFLGIFVSATIVAFCQLNILYGLAAVIFKVHWPNFINYLAITVALSLMIGGFAVFLSSLSYRSNYKKTSNIFSSFLVPILTFVGGGFFPVSQLGKSFEKFSSYTPVGAGVSAYLKAMQGYPIGKIYTELLAIVILAMILITFALILQPKRGEAV